VIVWGIVGSPGFRIQGLAFRAQEKAPALRAGDRLCRGSRSPIQGFRDSGLGVEDLYTIDDS
jgi:hypothetical protein